MPALLDWQSEVIMVDEMAGKENAAIPLYLVSIDALAGFQSAVSAAHQNWLAEIGFAAKSGQIAILPGEDGAISACAIGIGAEETLASDPFLPSFAAGKLPKGRYALAPDQPVALSDDAAALFYLAWQLGSYRFDSLMGEAGAARSPFDISMLDDGPALDAPAKVNADHADMIARSCHRAMHLINLPANILTPSSLAGVVKKLADEHKASFREIKGEALLAENFPLIHAVGRAGAEEPRLVELNWGKASDPKLCIIGKGVCFDSGGLNIKPGASMGLMKKDMGGAANAIGLAQMIMESGIGVNLRLLVPIVENSISAASFRPGDILRARNGMSVEVNNTDAEGRLVLADAIALAAEGTPDLIITLATLTGAARVALGPDIAPFFTDEDDLASALSHHSTRLHDPVWRLPLWRGYEERIVAKNADLDNAPAGGMAGAITAALFLRRFAGGHPFVHFDIYGWQPKAAPGRPFGGAAQAIRAIFSMLEDRYGG